MKTTFSSLVAKLLGLLATAALAAPIVPMASGTAQDHSEDTQKRAYGLVSPAHFDTPYFGRPVIGNYQTDIDAANADEVLGKKYSKGSKGAAV